VLDKLQDMTVAHELTRLASMAIVLLHHADARGEGVATHHLVAESDEYFEKAMAALGTPGLPLEAQLLACLDLQAYQVRVTVRLAAFGHL
jgi:hypothetical protein